MRKLWVSTFVLTAVILAAPVSAAPVKGRLDALPFDLALYNPGKAEMSGYQLILTAPKGSDMFTPSNGSAAVLNAPRVTFPASGDFIFFSQGKSALCRRLRRRRLGRLERRDPLGQVPLRAHQ